MNIPQLHETPERKNEDVRNDFTNSSFSAITKTRSGMGTGKVTIKLDCDYLQSLITSGKAKWVTEIRSPRGGYSKTTIHNGSHTLDINWDEEECSSETWIFISLAATETIIANTDSLTSVWKDEDDIMIQKGSKLAVAQVAKLTENRSSMIKFFKATSDNKEITGEGQMSMEIKDGMIFVYVGQDIWEETYDRDRYIAVLASGISKFALKYKDEEMPEEMKAVESLFEDLNIDLWTVDVENFDPLLAATKIEKFHQKEGDDDDSE